VHLQWNGVGTAPALCDMDSVETHRSRQKNASVCFTQLRTQQYVTRARIESGRQFLRNHDVVRCSPLTLALCDIRRTYLDVGDA